ncbi:MAG TPA: DUF4249 family protein [Bacteroidales bacterium]|nr:DUF4249 family protein [Bacteroidales bacterium]
MKSVAIYILLLTILLTSCVKTAEYPIGTDIKRPVLYSFINNNEIGVQLYWSRLLSEEGNKQTINNATVMLFEDDDYKGEMAFISDGYYKMNSFIPGANKEYKLLVDVPDYGEISAETRMPNEINPVFNLTIIEDSSSVILNQVFSDLAGIENFYFTNVKLLLYFGNNVIDTTILIELSSPMHDNLYNEKGTLFHDRMIDGQNYNCIINIENYYFNYYDGENHEHVYCDSAIIIPQFRIINKDFYHFYIDVMIQNYNNENAFSEPYPIHCNIVNGYGIMGAYFEYSDSLKHIPIH